MSDGAGAIHEQTRRNLIAAIQAEALAHATYLLYAAHARRNGAEALARTFERAARDELTRHFAQAAELLDLVGTDAENLRAAIEAERHDARAAYREYARKAEAAGDTVAAELFERVRADEQRHEREFRRALARVERAVPARV
jgi:rubrerythrin